MPDAVNTKEIRNLANWLYDESQNDWSIVARDAADALDELISDVDRLRTDRDFMLQTILRLRAVIDAAPHGETCNVGHRLSVQLSNSCSCWKAESL